MKKKQILICLAAMLLSQTASAATIDNIIQNENGKIEITGTFDVPGRVTLQMLEPGVESDTINDENVAASVHAIGESSTDNQGKFSKILTMKSTAADRGIYTVRIKNGDEYAEKTFVYYDSRVVNSEFNKLKNAKSADEVYNIVSSDNNAERFGINSAEYEELSTESKKKVAAAIYSEIKDINALEDLRKAYERQSVAEGISSGINAVEKLDNFADSIGIAEDKRYDSYSKMDSQKKKEVAERLKNADLSTKEKARKAFADAVFLTELKNSEGITSVKVLITANEDLFENNVLDKYKTSNDTSAVDRELAGKNFETVKAVSDKINLTLGEQTGGNEGNYTGSSGSSSGKNNTTIMPSIGVSPTVGQTTKITFSDLTAAEWARASVEYLAEKNIISGRDDGSFDPNANVTREEFVKMLVLAFNIDMNNKNSDFDDIKKTDWSYKYVSAAVEAGLVKGMDGKHFGRGVTITRQDMAVLVYRFANYVKATLPQGAITEFTDKGQIAAYATEAVSSLRAADIVSGMPGGEFKPMDPCTRAQAAKIIYTALQRIGRI